MTIEQYVRSIITRLPGIVADAMDAQRLQTELSVDISENMGEVNRKPVYPHAGSKLNIVTNALYNAAAVYKRKGNVSKTVRQGSVYAFEWGIDLDVIPYARIHELGGKAGRGLKTTIKPRPYIGPALKAFNESPFRDIVEDITNKLKAGL